MTAHAHAARLTRALALALATGLGLHAGGALANDGRALFVRGEVIVERGGQRVQLKRGHAVRQGDAIETGADGRAHLRMSDRSLLSLRPQTRVRIDEYRFIETTATREAFTRAQREAAAAANQGRSIYALVRGGLRTITGILGKDDRSEFLLRTPIATIGIRGTTFDVVCIDDCSGGLAFAAWDGRIEARTAAGTLILESGETGFASTDTAVPRRELKPHPALLADVRQRAGKAVKAAKVAGDTAKLRRLAELRDRAREIRTALAAEDREAVTAETERPPARRDIAYATAPFLASPGGAALSLATANEQLRFSADDGLASFIAAVPGNDGLTPARISALSENGVALFDAAADSDSGLRWGRYAGGFLAVEGPDGETTIPLDQQSFHFIFGTQRFRGDLVLPSSGSREFELVGSTTPSNDSGELGRLGSASLQADFASRQVQAAINLSLGQRSWAAAGAARLGSGVTGFNNSFAGDFSQIRIDAADGATDDGAGGSFSGFLTEQSRGAGLSYVLQASDGERISGAAAFRALSTEP